MKKSLYFIPILSSIAIPAIASISSCSCNIDIPGTPIPEPYLNIDSDGNLDGFKKEYIDQTLSGYTYLQVPTRVVSIKLTYIKSYVAYDCITKIVGDDKGKWTTIHPISSLPNLTTIILPKTITTIDTGAFNKLRKLNTIDVSSIDNINIFNSNQFYDANPSKAITNGKFIVKSDADGLALKEIFKENDWLKNWSYEIKK